jgi:hypothetical protein
MWWLMTFTSIGFTVATCPNASNYGVTYGGGGKERRKERRKKRRKKRR